MGKKILATLLIVFTVVLGICLGALMKYKSIVGCPFDEEIETVTVVANKGTFSGVLVDNEDVFNGEMFIKLYNKINKVSISVKKGIYEFPSNMSLPDIISSLENGDYNTSIVKVTFPEGYTIEQMSKLLESKGVVSATEFIEACENYVVPEYVVENKLKRYSLEGYLFPDTYMFEKGMNANNIISVMLNRFESVLKEIEKENDVFIDTKDIENLIIKASLIEREVSKQSEKSMVSSVIDNRLDKDMKLQIDATVLYAMGKHKDKLYLDDLKVKSKYNTYYISGLPIGAISNPGKESIVAALLPKDTDYIYYMTKDGLNHKFFKTYDEFVKYKNKK